MMIKSIFARIILNYEHRSIITSAISFLSTVIFLIYNFIAGYLYHSVWNLSISFYYLSLVILRGLIIFSEKKWSHIEEKRRNSYRIRLFSRSSKLLLVMDLVLIVPIILMVLSQRNVIMGLVPAITVAAYTTYKIAISIANYKKAKKHNNLSILTLRIINLKDAIVSILTLQNTMIMALGSGKSMQTMTAYTSLAITVLLITITVLMIHKGKRFDIDSVPLYS